MPEDDVPDDDDVPEDGIVTSTLTGARTKARKRAVDMLYAADLRGLDPLAVLQTAQARPATHDTPAVPAYAADLVRGVVEHRVEIDDLLSRYAEGWTLERMPAVDRNILRVGVQELLYAGDVPSGVAVSEAVELASALSTEESPRFVNGLLARVAREAGTATLVTSRAPEPDFPV